MAKHGGDRRSASARVTKKSNGEILLAIHVMELVRLARSNEIDTTVELADLWPEGYAALVAEAQRRKLCL